VKNVFFILFLERRYFVR